MSWNELEELLFLAAMLVMMFCVATYYVLSLGVYP